MCMSLLLFLLLLSSLYHDIALHVTTLCTVASTLCTVASTLCTVASTLCTVASTLCTVASTLCTVASTLCTVASTTVAILSSDRQSLFLHIDSRSVSSLHVFLSFTLLIFIVSQ
jgi:hypothetical protein